MNIRIPMINYEKEMEIGSTIKQDLYQSSADNRVKEVFFLVYQILNEILSKLWEEMWVQMLIHFQEIDFVKLDSKFTGLP